MVTGSHIPDDRNGIKFNDLYGEILKDDEVAIRNQVVTLPLEKFDANQNLIQTNNDFLTSIDTSASLVYQRRYTEFFAPNCLSNLRIGLYQHSSVSRDILYNILTQLGARVTPLERSEHFIPVDTEAVRQLDQDLAYKWAATGQFDCIVSTDGDGDRPLFADETGTWWRGDIVGILTARYLGIRTIVTPISSNTAVESSNWFSTVTRTRIGSPYVIVNMQKAVTTGLSPVAGYEANGGFLLASSIIYKDKILTALPTRDATIVILSILLLARETACTASQLLTTLPARYTASGRLQNFSAEVSKQRIDALVTNSMLLNTEFTKYFGNVKEINIIDGLRMTFDNGEILHLRPSGNAPELRAYAEAATPTRANAMVQNAIELLEQWRN
jgi:phosphomannomutase